MLLATEFDTFLKVQCNMCDLPIGHHQAMAISLVNRIIFTWKLEEYIGC